MVFPRSSMASPANRFGPDEEIRGGFLVVFEQSRTDPAFHRRIIQRVVIPAGISAQPGSLPLIEHVFPGSVHRIPVSAALSANLARPEAVLSDLPAQSADRQSHATGKVMQFPAMVDRPGLPARPVSGKSHTPGAAKAWW